MQYSFIIPVYNCKSYLPACVESILATGAEDFEILLVDDGSTDGSGALCDALAGKYPCIRVLHKTNGGVSSARNAGLDAARGEYILFIDADDGLESGMLGSILADPQCWEVDMTLFGMTFDYYSKGKCYRRDPLIFDWEGRLSRQDWTAAFHALFCANSLSPVWNKILRREIIEENGLRFQENLFLYEDLEFAFRFLAHCRDIRNVPQPVYHYRQSEDEGNAGRRLKRIDRISVLLAPMEDGLQALVDVPRQQKEDVCLALFRTLAREKIAVSPVSTIRAICDDYAQWYLARGFDRKESPFHRDLMGRKAIKLYLSAQKTAQRHRIAVWAKAHHLYR